MTLNTSPTIDACLNPPEGTPLQRADWQAMLTQIMQAAFYGQSRVVSRAVSASLTPDDAGTLSRCTAELTLTLPLASAVSNGWGKLVIAQGGDVTVSRSGADFIDGDQTSVTVERGGVVSIVCDGTGFRTALRVGQFVPFVTGHGGKVLRVKADGSGIEFFQAGDLVVADQKPQNTAGGTFTSGAWRQRDLNTVQTNTITGASLTANRVTLPAGTYKVQGGASAFAVQRHIARLYNVTASAEVLRGTSQYTLQTSSVSTLQGVFTLSETSLIELQHRCEITNNPSGFGLPANLDGVETYSWLAVERLA